LNDFENLVSANEKGGDSEAKARTLFDKGNTLNVLYILQIESLGQEKRLHVFTGTIRHAEDDAALEARHRSSLCHER
jgi:hypothetical protein